MANSYFNENTLEELIEEIRYVYKSDDRPWVIGYSGGKDSTTVVELVYKMLLGLSPEERHKNVYIVSSDTLIENPLIKIYLSKMNELLGKAADRDKLPIKSAMVTPPANNSFWANVIGRGNSLHHIEPSDDTLLTVAHPFQMYKQGMWHTIQKYVFDNQIIQPFKQVFRELYVKTEEELNMEHSLRYAGNQIQPRKTVACLRTRHWVADIEEGLQKVYYKENIVARIYALADWFSPADIESPTLEWVVFTDRKTGKDLKIREIPDIIFSEVMRDVDLAVSVAHAGGVDPETSHSTVEMRKAIAEFTMPLFKLTNVTFTKNHAVIQGARANYTVHLGSGVVHQEAGPMINVLPVHSQRRGRIFLPFVDDDPKTSEVLTKILFFAEDKKIKDPFILEQIRQ